MQWENLTVGEFSQAVKDTGVCILALGVIEKHSEHLPLGTDFLNAHKICCLATEKEPAVVFPPFYFGQIYEARCFPGTVTISPTLLLELLQGVMDEMGRNGFSKVILYNGHGGNTNLVRFLAQCSLWEQKPYSVYLFTDQMSEERRAKWNSLLDTKIHGHACECETSISLANHAELVKMDRVVPDPAVPLHRLANLPSHYSANSWYAAYPDHYAGDARTASREKGFQLRELQVDNLAEYIAAVKTDQVVTMLDKEFFERESNLHSTSK